MELLLLLALLSAQKGGNAQAALQDFLAFYRENRDLIRLFADGRLSFAGTDSASDAAASTSSDKTPPDKAPPDSAPPDKSSSAADGAAGSASGSAAPDLRILEEYLKRNAAP